MAVASVTSNPQESLVASLNKSGTGTAVSNVQEMSDRFLKLLVTQLKNQDPMNPMENAELTMQLAQMSTVEGINNLNKGLDALNAQFKASQVIQGASMVGRNVLAEGDELILSSSVSIGAMELATKADSVRVDVLDENGAIVRSLELGKQDAGLVRFGWDGKATDGTQLADGDYSFKVTATAAGEKVEAVTYALGQVMSVALKDDAMEVEISNLGNRGMDQIRQIF
jgi:flagellar basal-body rod modification protein FlgD